MVDFSREFRSQTSTVEFNSTSYAKGGVVNVSNGNEAVLQRIAAWQPATDVPNADPLHVVLTGRPAYLPLLQPKTWFSHYGLRSQSLRVLGLNTEGAWIEDGMGRGTVSWVYGAAEQCFGKAPFALSPLAWAKARFPELAERIWDERIVEQIADRFLHSWEALRAEASVRDQVESMRLPRHGLETVAAALGRLETGQTTATLVEAADSHSPRIRRAAAVGMAQMTPQHTIEVALMLLAEDVNADVREAAVRGLPAVRDDQSHDVLVRRLEDVPAVQRATIDALVAIGDAGSLQHVLGVIADRSAEDVVRATAVLALQTFWQRSFVALLGELLTDRAPSVRTAAAYVLGKLGDTDVVRSLQGVLGDQAPEVRVAAVYALVDLRDETSIPTLLEWAKRNGPYYVDPFSGQAEDVSALAWNALVQMAQQGSSKASQVVKQYSRD